MEGLFKSDSAEIQVFGLAAVSERASPQSEFTLVQGRALARYCLESSFGARPREFYRQARSAAHKSSRSQAFRSVPVSERATSRVGNEERQCRRNLTSQWSGRLRAAHCGAAHRRVRCQIEIPELRHSYSKRESEWIGSLPRQGFEGSFQCAWLFVSLAGGLSRWRSSVCVLYTQEEVAQGADAVQRGAPPRFDPRTGRG